MNQLLEIFQRDPETLIIMTVILLGSGVATVAIVFGSFSSVRKRRLTEESRREIAAYIAEGSMTPEQGERLLQAGNRKDSCCG